MLSIVEAQFGAALGQLLLNEVRTSKEMMKRLWKAGDHYHAAADMAPERSKAEQVLRLAGNRARSLSNLIYNNREGNPERAQYWKEEVRKYTDKQYPERVQRRQERIEQERENFYNRMLQRAQGGKKV